MLSRLYDALRDGDAGDEKARAAAEEAACYENRLSSVEPKLAVLAWMVDTNIVLTLAVFWGAAAALSAEAAARRLQRSRRNAPVPAIVAAMETVLDRPWTTETFLAWEDRQEGKHEFDGQHVIPMTGGSVAHQEIVFNLRVLLGRLLADRPFRALQEMRLRIGTRVRYPDVLVVAGPLNQTTRTLTDAVAIFEVLSDDSATNDRVGKLIDYAEVPALRSYVLLEQTAVAATMFQRDQGGAWIASPHTAGVLVVPGLDIILPLADLYQGLTFQA